jgi:hypothetical protein
MDKHVDVAKVVLYSQRKFVDVFIARQVRHVAACPILDAAGSFGGTPQALHITTHKADRRSPDGKRRRHRAADAAAASGYQRNLT